MLHGEFDVLDGGEYGLCFGVEEGILNGLLQRALLQFVYVLQVSLYHLQQLWVSKQHILFLLPLALLHYRSLARLFYCLLSLRRSNTIFN